MARKSPLGKIRDAALDTIKDPIGSGQKAVGQAVGQAKGTVGLGRAVAGQVTGEVFGAVTGLVPGRKRSAEDTSGAGSQGGSDPVPAPSTRANPAPATKKTAKEHGDPVKPPVQDVATEVVKKASTRAPAGKGSVAKAATKRATGKKTPAQKTPAKKAPESPIDAAADSTDVDVTPADVAKAVAKAPAKKSPAKKSAAKKATAAKAPAKKAPAKKSPAKKSTPSGKIPPRKAPLSAAELAAGAGTETITPVGTRGADVSTNPDTTDHDLQQVGTEPLVDPSTTKAVASEADTLGKASDPDRG
ncbi:hypothetical protein [Nocardioides sp. SYSU DS0663]|uniref:hypothetical protein n=1 Tax=Nocardioides sp. SYSU DS0663 TaxID=3416445 RepID=UPI003F4C1DF5